MFINKKIISKAFFELVNLLVVVVVVVKAK